jgi:hypothetical protein
MMLNIKKAVTNPILANESPNKLYKISGTHHVIFWLLLLFQYFPLGSYFNDFYILLNLIYWGSLFI